MLLSFLGVTAYLVAAIVFISLALVVALFVPDVPNSRARRKSKSKKSEKKPKSRLSRFFLFLVSEILTQRNCLILLVLIVGISLFRQPKPLYENWGLVCLLELSLAFLIMNTLPFKMFDTLSMLIGGIYLIAIVSFNNQIIHCQNVTGKPLRNAEFKADKTIIKSDSETIYVGMTRNYLFLYNSKQKKTRVFERSKITDLTITSSSPVQIRF